MVQGDLKIEHKGTDEMWGDMNTTPEVIGVSVDYDDDDERRRTHPLLLPKIESERILVTDGEVLEKAAIIVPTSPIRWSKETSRSSTRVQTRCGGT